MPQLTLLLLLLLSLGTFAQEQCPRFQKYPIANTGTFAYFPQAPSQPEISQMDDGTLVYTLSADCQGFTYGLLLVQMTTNPAPNFDTTLENYLQVLKEMGQIQACAGYGRGHRLDSHPEAIGIIDYCEDAQQNQWAYKGWIDTRFAALLYIVSPVAKRDTPINHNFEQLFLNGFRFQ